MNDEEIRRAHIEHGNPFEAELLDALGAGVAVSADGATVRLEDGRERIDLASGGLQYGHPLVTERVLEQLERMPLSARVFFSRPLARLVSRIAELAPGELGVSFFGNSGTEAIEGALKLALGYHPKRRRVVAMSGGFHGSTTGALSVSGVQALRGAVREHPVQATFVPFGDVEAATKAIDFETVAVIFEPIQAGSGVRVPPAGFLRALRERCTATGALLISDEVTTGLGRTGKWWGVDHDDVKPDIMTIAGALGGGVLPIGAYVTTRAINSKVYDKRDPLLHANTTGGNPSACTAALACLEVLAAENMPARALEMGAIIDHFSKEWARRYGEEIRQVQSKGLLAGIQLARVAAGREIQKAALARGVSVRVDGLTHDEAWIGLRPPLLISKVELELGLERLGSALENVFAGRAVARAEVNA